MHVITVELHVPDLDLASTFYRELGFKDAWRDERTGSRYLVMQLEGWPICFKAWDNTHSYFGKDDGQRGNGVEIVIAVAAEHLESHYRRAERSGALVAELQTRPWGARDFRIADPFGYYLRFTESVDVLSADYGGRPT